LDAFHTAVSSTDHGVENYEKRQPALEIKIGFRRCVYINAFVVCTGKAHRILRFFLGLSFQTNMTNNLQFGYINYFSNSLQAINTKWSMPQEYFISIILI